MSHRHHEETRLADTELVQIMVASEYIGHMEHIR
jgi:hypothetical protein